MSSPATFQYDPGDAISFGLLPAGMPITTPGYLQGGGGGNNFSPDGGVRVGSGRVCYDLPDVPPGALALSAGSLWSPDTAALYCPKPLNIGGVPPYDFSDWGASLLWDADYTLSGPHAGYDDPTNNPLAGPSPYPGVYYLEDFVDRTSLLIEIGGTALAAGFTASATHTIYLKRHPFIYGNGPDGPRSRIFRFGNYYPSIDGYAFDLVHFEYQTTHPPGAYPFNSSFFVAAHWLMDDLLPGAPSPRVVNAGDDVCYPPGADPEVFMATLTPPLYWNPGSSNAGQKQSGAVFLFESNEDYQGREGTSGTLAAFKDQQEAALESLAYDHVSLISLGLSYPENNATHSRFVSPLDKIAFRGTRFLLPTGYIEAHAPGPTPDLTVRYKFEMLTRSVPLLNPDGSPRTAAGDYFDASPLVYDDGPQYVT